MNFLQESCVRKKKKDGTIEKRQYFIKNIYELKLCFEFKVSKIIGRDFKFRGSEDRNIVKRNY
ncbi:hypothetical protein ASJ81_05585 [Methanosarcina spelaei]|uniref:Uncharacterized protein n=1 Tax=Methanosarcina spelaei TaxID=1036679 RepID=A0A2A2HTA4_9EURY|nr:hypothetical protein ASJ81_05585 [Methanosarcina spelaei]